MATTYLVCAAPECTNPRSGSAHHCPTHMRLFLPLYTQYKAAERRLERRMVVDMRAKDPKKLLACYGRLKAAYEMRSAYRERAFRRELWDGGHEMRIERLLSWMYEVEERLSAVFTASQQREEVLSETDLGSEDDDDEESAEDESLGVEVQAVRSYNARVLEEERTWKEVVPRLVLERASAMAASAERVAELVGICRGALEGDERRLDIFDESATTTHYLTRMTFSVLYRVSVTAAEMMRERVPGYAQTFTTSHLSTRRGDDHYQILLHTSASLLLMTMICKGTQLTTVMIPGFLRAAVDAHRVGSDSRAVKMVLGRCPSRDRFTVCIAPILPSGRSCSSLPLPGGTFLVSVTSERVSCVSLS
jgi:hypothetical protein